MKTRVQKKKYGYQSNRNYKPLKLLLYFNWILEWGTG